MRHYLLLPVLSFFLATPALAEEDLIISVYGRSDACIIAKVEDGQILPLAEGEVPSAIGPRNYWLYSLQGEVTQLPGDAPAESTCYDNPVVSTAFPKVEGGEYSNDEPLVAISRPIETAAPLNYLSPDDPALIADVRSLLDAQGLTSSPVKIRQAIEVDVDGDGRSEQLLTAWAAEPDDDIYREGQAGDYALIAMRHEGLHDWTLVHSNFKGFWAYSYEIVAIFDANGDGKQELIVEVQALDLAAKMLLELRDGIYEWRAACGCVA